MKFYNHVYAVYDRSVTQAKKYKAKPKSDFFESQEEAQTEMNKMYQNNQHKPQSLKIMMLLKMK